MERKVKRIDIKEFREKGYLQELNRRFLHPLGMALEVVIEDDGKEILGDIWDYRDDVEGIYYDIINFPKERQEKFKKNFDFIEKQLKDRKQDRSDKLGFFMEDV